MRNGPETGAKRPKTREKTLKVLKILQKTTKSIKKLMKNHSKRSNMRCSEDFLSIPQPPMSPDQEPWTEEDSQAVQQAETPRFFIVFP